ncbi:hypothetical protein RSAG8_12072, partial [Rhizoctonia solani AG-8 WAC10335]
MNRPQCSSERLDHFNCPLCSQATTQHLPNCDWFTQQSSKGLKVQASASNTNQISKALALQMSDMAPPTTSPTPSSASTHIRPPALALQMSDMAPPTTSPTPSSASTHIRPPVNTKKHQHPASLSSPARTPTKRGRQLSNPTTLATDSPRIQPARYRPYPSLPTPSATLQLPTNAAHTPNFADPSGLETAPTPINNHPVSRSSTYRQVSPLPLISELFPSERQLAIDLSVSRDNMKWVEWEHQLIMSCLLGPQTSPATIMHLMHMPPRARTEESLAELLPLFRNGTPQWLQLLGLFDEIEKFAIHFGLDLNSPEFDSIPVLVNRIVAIWKHYIPEGEGWGKLKLTDIGTWTYDPRNGWLAMMYRRLREVGIRSPRGGQARSKASTRPPSDISDFRYLSSSLTPSSNTINPTPPPSQAIPACEYPFQADGSNWESQSSQVAWSLATPSDAFTEGDKPSPAPVSNSQGLESLHDPHVTLGATDEGNDFLEVDQEVLGCSQDTTLSLRSHSPVAQADNNSFAHYLKLAQGERDKLYKAALEVMQTCDANSPARASAEAWISRCYFDPDLVVRLIRGWMASFGLHISLGTPDPDQAPIITTPSTPLSLPGLDESPSST